MKFVEGNEYLLKTFDECGYKMPESDWIKVVFDGVNLIDKDGCCWNEWKSTASEVVEVLNNRTTPNGGRSLGI